MDSWRTYLHDKYAQLVASGRRWLIVAVDQSRTYPFFFGVVRGSQKFREERNT